MSDFNPVEFIKRIVEVMNPMARRLVQEWVPGGKFEGNEYVVLNPRRNDNSTGSFKFNVSNCKGADFAEDTKFGDVVSLFAYLEGIDQYAAAVILGQTIGITPPPSPRGVAPSVPRKSKPVIAKVPEPPEENRRFAHRITKEPRGIPHEVYIYLDADGADYAAACFFYEEKRSDNPLKPFKKNVLPYDFSVPEGGGSWKLREAPRCLYNLPLLIANPTASVVVVEGEKTAQRATEFVEDYFAQQNGRPEFLPIVFTTWQGGAGTKQINGADWSVLRGKNVFVSPDDDPTIHSKNGPSRNAGRDAALVVASVCIGSDALQVLIMEPGDRGRWGWDLANYNPEVDGCFTKLLQKLKKNALEVADFKSLLVALKQDRPVSLPGDNDDKFPFRILGVGKEGKSYWFQAGRSQKIMELQHRDIVKLDNLSLLAPRSWWNKHYSNTAGEDGKERARFNGNMAGEDLINLAQKKGEVDIQATRRGRGAWRTDKGIVIHAGDQVLVNNKWVQPMSIDDPNFIFEKHARIPVPTIVEASRNEVQGFIDLAECFSFTGGKLAAHIVVGWCAAALFCGVYDWRPHLCITGPAGSGKTTLHTRVIEFFLGDWALSFLGNTTEPGLRRALLNDARPTILDEIEPSGDDNRARSAQAVLQLCRVASSETGGMIQLGDGTSYKPRTMACFCSINPKRDEEADRSRFFHIALNSLRDVSAENLVARRHRLDALTSSLPRDIGMRVFWRMYHYREALVAGLAPFRDAGAELLSNERAGDQLAPVFSALHILLKSEDPYGKITKAEAKKFMQEYPLREWEAIFTDLEDREHGTLLSAMFSITMEGNRETIGEAITWLAEEMDATTNGRESENPLDMDFPDNEQFQPKWLENKWKRLNNALAAHGIRVMKQANDGMGVAFANGHNPKLSRQLMSSRMKDDSIRRDTLTRIEGAFASKQPYRFSNMPKARAIVVPIQSLGLTLRGTEGYGEDGA